MKKTKPIKKKIIKKSAGQLKPAFELEKDFETYDSSLNELEWLDELDDLEQDLLEQAEKEGGEKDAALPSVAYSRMKRRKRKYRR